jgi:glycosyltransferase involved in cell wall biosynthesis
MARPSLNIGLLSAPCVAPPSQAHDGTQMIVAQLARGLVAAGQSVTVFPTGDCPVPGSTAHGVSSATDEPLGGGFVDLQHVMAGHEALAGCDVVHDHTLLGPAWALASNRRTVLTTCHGPLTGELRSVYGRYAARLPVVATSHEHVARAPEIAFSRVIHDCLDLDRFPMGRGAGGYLLFLGRLAPANGVREAVLLSRAVGRPLVIAAKMRAPAEYTYFDEEARPLLGDDVMFVGEAVDGAKLDLLAGATALLNPIHRPEPFGLAMTEALACGTPVVTCSVGAATEIVEHGVTGFICDDRTELVDALAHVGDLDRTACRAAVAERFSTERMVAEYLSLYELMVNSDSERLQVGPDALGACP